MAAWPTLKEVRTVLRKQPDAVEDGVIQTALAAAINYGQGRMGSELVDNGDGTFGPGRVPIYPGDTTALPDAAHQACLIHAARLYRRRDSVDGTIGFGDLGVVRVGRTDADRDDLYANVAPMVFG
jgi:hypothetical protein